MPNDRRNFVPGGTYFFTVVTHERRPILTTDLARSILRQSVRNEKAKRPFEIVAAVLLPDHLHAVWTLPRDDFDFSTRWTRIKSDFSRLYLAKGGSEGTSTISRQRHSERAVWQRRFWGQTCRDEDDAKRCVDYLHANPVKHGLAQAASADPCSSFHRFVLEGE